MVKACQEPKSLPQTEAVLLFHAHNEIFHFSFLFSRGLKDGVCLNMPQTVTVSVSVSVSEYYLLFGDGVVYCLRSKLMQWLVLKLM